MMCLFSYPSLPWSQSVIDNWVSIVTQMTDVVVLVKRLKWYWAERIAKLKNYGWIKLITKFLSNTGEGEADSLSCGDR